MELTWITSQSAPHSQHAHVIDPAWGVTRGGLRHVKTLCSLLRAPADQIVASDAEHCRHCEARLVRPQHL